MKRAAVWTAAALAALFFFVENACPQKQIGFHLGFTSAHDYSPENHILATGGEDGAMLLWDPSTGEIKRILEVIDSPIKSVQFSPNGRYLVCYVKHNNRKYIARIWDVETGERIRLHQRRVIELAVFSDDDRIMAYGDNSDEGISLWNLKTRQKQADLNGSGGRLTAAAFSPDGRLFAACVNDSLMTWNVETAELVASVHDHPDTRIQQLKFLPDNRSLASVNIRKYSRYRTVSLWDAETGKQKRFFVGNYRRSDLSPDGRSFLSHSVDKALQLRDIETGEVKLEEFEDAYSHVFSSDGRSLAISYKDDSVRIWDVDTGALQSELIGLDGIVLAFSKSGNNLVVANYYEGSLEIWNRLQRETIHQFRRHGSRIDTVAFTPDGLSVFSSSANSPYGEQTARIWDVETGELKNSMEQSSGQAALSPDGQTAAFSFHSGVLLRDAAAGRETAVFRAYSIGIGAVAFSPDSKKLAFSIGGKIAPSIQLWDIATEEVLKMFTTFPGETHSIAFSPDGNMIAGAGEDPRILIGNVSSNGLMRQLNGHESDVYSVAFSPNSLTLASAGEDGAIRLWNVETGQTRSILQGHNRSVLTVAFSPDGRMLASGGEDGTIRLWNAATGELNRTIETRSGSVNAVAFSPDSRSLVSGGQDGRVLLWRFENLPYLWSDIRRPNTPLKTILLPNYPNPFNPETWIPFDLAKQSAVTIAIYNAAGRTVRVLELGELPAGSYRAKEKAAFWDGRNSLGAPAASGVYFARIQAGSFSETRRMVLLK